MESAKKTPQPTKRQMAKKSANRVTGTRISQIWDSRAKPSDMWKPNEIAPINDDIKPHLVDDEAIRAYGQLKKLPMIQERYVDREVRDKYNLTASFTALNCSALLDGSELIYPDLVKQFYANMTVAKNKSWVKSSIKGKEVRLTSRKVGEALKISDDGLNIFDPPEDISFEQVVNTICNGVVHIPKKKGSVELDAHYLKEHLRIVNRICHFNIYPKGSHSPKVRKEVCYFLYCLETGTACDVAKMIVGRICELNSFHLLFPGLLTKLFKYFDIAIDDEVSIPNSLKFTMENVRKILAERDRGKAPTVDEEKFHPKPERVIEQLAYLECSFKWMKNCLEEGFKNIARNQKKMAEFHEVEYEEMELPDYEKAMQDWYDEFHPAPADEEEEPPSGSSSRPATRSQKKRKVK